ncbi:hypothetical protein OG871_04685 [Kitasatospora sp. NBC_00374]|uniref:hypothetical protein n=1 Tax=Kitasatospora sp. NBC_00374 TaxID=2975964 RepID=UPI003252CFA1
MPKHLQLLLTAAILSSAVTTLPLETKSDIDWPTPRPTTTTTTVTAPDAGSAGDIDWP